MVSPTFRDLIDTGHYHLYGQHIPLWKRFEVTWGTKSVLQWLLKNDLYLKPKKCKFAKTKIEWLGMIIEEGWISMDAGKLKGIQDWLTPTSVKEIRGFLGFGNFYWWFIWHYSNITKPLNDTTKKDQPFKWTTDCQEAFDDLKKQFTEEPILMMPD